MRDGGSVDARLNESPYEKVGKLTQMTLTNRRAIRLNESPYEKVGKSRAIGTRTPVLLASMKVPTKK